MKLGVCTLLELLSENMNLDPTSTLPSKSLQTTKAGMSSDCVKTTIHLGEISDYHSFFKSASWSLKVFATTQPYFVNVYVVFGSHERTFEIIVRAN